MARGDQVPFDCWSTSYTSTDVVRRVPVGGGGGGTGVDPVMVMFTVRAACEPATVLLATLLLSDSAAAELTARTAKYHVPGASELMVAERLVTSLMMVLFVSAVLLVP